jgi:isopentenyl-diphosphate delta-isomerase
MVGLGWKVFILFSSTGVPVSIYLSIDVCSKTSNIDSAPIFSCDFMDQKVILVDENDREIGLEEKLKAHQDGGRLHRAVSVFVFNKKGEVMMQKRALGKYHEGGKWSSTCCSHPMPGEMPIDAAHRRLREEMGFDCELKEVGSFIYKAVLGKGLVEWEYDHFFKGVHESDPRPSKEEVEDWRWESVEGIRERIKKNPKEYAGFFLAFFERAVEAMESHR